MLKGRRLMINLRAAFDASMDQPCGITTVAGYIAGQDQWLEVERRWNGHLAIAGLDYFHLREIKNRYPGKLDKSGGTICKGD